MTRGSVRKSLTYGFVLLAAGLYTYLTFTAPPQPAAPGFEIAEPWKTIIRISFILPTLLSWLFGALAFDYLTLAARHTSQPSFMKMLRLLGYGVLALTGGSWISSMIGQIRTDFFASGSGPDVASSVALNYAYVVFPLIGFALVYLASRSRSVQAEPTSQNLPAAIPFIAIIGALWVATIFTNTSRQVTTIANARPTYYINDVLIVLTLIVPMLAAWFFGIVGALNLSDLETEGELPQRKAFSQIVLGVLSALFSSIILNGLLSAGAERLLGAGLVMLLAFVYLLVFLILFSYWMIYRGAKKLFDALPPA